MKSFAISLLTVVCFASLTAGCSGHAISGSETFTDTVYAPKYASGFVVTKEPGHNSLLFTVTAPWQFADSTAVQHFLMLSEGEEVPAGFRGQVLTGVANRIVTMSTTHIAILDAVGAANTVVGVSGYDYISNPTVLRRLDRTADIGYEGNVNYEMLAAMEPDLVLLYGVSGPSIMEAKLSDLGVPYFYVGDYVEESPLGKAEWMLPIGMLCGHERQAEAYLGQLEERYNAIKQTEPAYRPKVMVNMPYNDTWFMPSTNSYMAQLIVDAGGEPVYKANSANGSDRIDLEKAYLLTDSADVWINTGSAADIAELLATVPNFGGVTPVVNRTVFNCTARVNAHGGNDYFETGTVEPDLILDDLRRIFFDPLVPDTLNYYVRLR